MSGLLTHFSIIDDNTKNKVYLDRNGSIISKRNGNANHTFTARPLSEEHKSMPNVPIAIPNRKEIMEDNYSDLDTDDLESSDLEYTDVSEVDYFNKAPANTVVKNFNDSKSFSDNFDNFELDELDDIDISKLDLDNGQYGGSNDIKAKIENGINKRLSQLLNHKYGKTSATYGMPSSTYDLPKFGNHDNHGNHSSNMDRSYNHYNMQGGAKNKAVSSDSDSDVTSSTSSASGSKKKRGLSEGMLMYKKFAADILSKYLSKELEKFKQNNPDKKINPLTLGNKVAGYYYKKTDKNTSEAEKMLAADLKSGSFQDIIKKSYESMQEKSKDKKAKKAKKKEKELNSTENAY